MIRTCKAKAAAAFAASRPRSPGTFPRMPAVASGNNGPAVSPDLVNWAAQLLMPWFHYVSVTHRRLFLFLAAAFLFHLFLLGFIRIDTTRQPTARPLRPIATLEISQDTHLPQPLRTEDWDELSDPRIFLAPPAALTSGASTSFLNDLTAPAPVTTSGPLPLAAEPGFELLHPTLDALSSRLQKTLQPARAPFTYQVPPLQMSTQSTWQWNETLAARAPLTTPELPSPVSNTPLTPTQVRLAVDETGTVRYALLEQSCGKPELDQQALSAAQKIRFQPLPPELTLPSASPDSARLAWGTATLFWYSIPTPQEQVLPTPPTN